MSSSSPVQKTKTPVLALAALGVIFGDIGTSPLYTMKEVFGGHHQVAVTPDNVMGVISMILWSLIMVVTVKYVIFMMRADNRGEGGIMALIALATQQAGHNRLKLRFITLAGIIGASMFFADGMVTPAITVLSAVEGLEVVAANLGMWVIPITLTVLLILFSVQRHGTATVGKLFGPIMMLWFLSLGALGIINIVHNPDILWALNPLHAVHFFTNNHWLAFLTLGAVVLSVTGGEALYADMGHFGRVPIRYAWFFLVLPCLMLNYFGQGALLLHDASAVKNPFYLLAPTEILMPLIVLTTMATVIASQSVISGTFSIARQAFQLGFMPRTLVTHTSESEAGQIYLPKVNWALMVGVMTLVLFFQNSSNLAAAYGIAVTGDMIITTLLASLVFHSVWKWSWAKTLALTGVFFTIDLAFFSANVLKIPAGGWFPILVGIVLFTLMLTWKRGRELLYKRLKDDAMHLDSLIEALGVHPPTRVPGTAVFMTPNPYGVPHALLHNLKHNKVLHEQIVLLTIKYEDVPHSDKNDRLIVEELPHGFYRVQVQYGFMDEPNLPRDLEHCAEKGLPLELMDTSFFIGKEILIARRGAPFAFWRQKLFVGMFRNASSITDHLKLPPNRVVELGSQLTL
ncbi:MAG: potassium transporter Kup [Methylobacillus sp.]|jgi:KUP system potassium uptake protein|nr:potassium transporter Kup [Methylobacillus sp.]